MNFINSYFYVSKLYVIVNSMKGTIVKRLDIVF